MYVYDVIDFIILRIVIYDPGKGIVYRKVNTGPTDIELSDSHCINSLK